MHIIHLMRKPQTGFQSIERLFENIRRKLPDAVTVEVIYCRHPTRGFLPRLFNLFQVLKLRADIIHITGDINYLALALLGRKVIITQHDLAPYHSKKGLRKMLFSLLWYKLPFRIARAITVISRTIAEEVTEHLGTPAERITLIPNCIGPEFCWYPKPWPERPTVLIVGTRPQKNIPLMLQAFKGLPVDIKLVGPLDDRLLSDLEKIGTPFQSLGSITQDQLVEAYQQSDILAFCSTYEGFGLPVIEAQATGRVVLTSDIPVLREVAGDGACFVVPTDVDSIRQGLERLLRDPGYRQQLIEAGSKNAQRFTATAIAKRYAEVYISL
jgi:glycosyltransferase involved in cell wall biosynthesis